MKRVLMVAGIACVTACGSRGTGTAALPPVRMVSPDSADLQSARFSPDWSHLYWWQPAGAGRQLWMSDTSFKAPIKLQPTTVLTRVELLWSPDGSQIAVPAGDTGSGVSAVMVMSPDGSNARRLPLGSGLFVPLGWNRDGDRIAYGALVKGAFYGFVTSVTRGGSAPLIPGETRPAAGIWSPDGSHIAFQVNDQGRNTVWVADSDGGNRRALTTDGFEQFGAAGMPWSPDSRELAYESRRTGTADVWVVPIDGKPARQLTHDVLNDSWPIWSPDGKWIVFLSDRGKQTDLWVVPAAGGIELRVTNDALVEEPMEWRPGTRQFAYLTGRGTSGIWRMSLADGAEQQLTPDSIQAGRPALSPDGKQVAFRIDRGGGVSDIGLTPTTGGPLRILVSGGANSAIAWSPDGSHLAFVSDRGGTPDIWIVDVATAKPTQLENWPGVESNPTWSEDGSSVYFTSDRDARIADIWRAPIDGSAPVRVTTQGAVNNITTRTGVAGLYAAIIGATGQFTTVRVMPDGRLVTMWDRGNSLPGDVMPRGDSVVVMEIRPGGLFDARIAAANGKGGGAELLQPGETYADVSADGARILYYVASSGTNDIGILNRADGTRRRLTNTSADEVLAAMTPDGNAIVFERRRPIRRVAVVDLTKMLERAEAAAASGH